MNPLDKGYPHDHAKQITDKGYIKMMHEKRRDERRSKTGAKIKVK